MTKTGGGKILIAEDERPLRHALELKLTHAGFAVTTAADGQEALDLVEKEKFDLIILDLIMPNVDGFGVLEQLKAKKVKTPVIVSSNLGQEVDKERAASLGAVDYFVKSNTPISQIVQNVQHILRS